jgi:hypothetical protein
MAQIFGCQPKRMPVPEPEAQPIIKEVVSTVKAFSQPAVIFVYPDAQMQQEAKAQLGDEAFYMAQDAAGKMFSEIRRLLKDQGIFTQSTDKNYFTFALENGALVHIDLSSIKIPWTAIAFDGIHNPAIIDPANAEEEIFRLFPQLKPESKIRKSKPPALSDNTTDTLINEQIQPSAHSAVADNIPVNPMPGQWPKTIRLFVPPGAATPPPRDETSGLRLVTSYIDPAHKFWLNFDNDIFSYTDRYYTNGVTLGYAAPSFAVMPVSKLLPLAGRTNVSSASISLHHAMYTPFTTKTPPSLMNDRPYASTLFVRYSLLSENTEKGITLSSSIDLGVMGEAALGSFFQKTVHAGVPNNDEPLGWETQIGNDVVLNYNINVFKDLLRIRNFELLSRASIQLGTLYTRAGSGFDFSIGRISQPANKRTLRPHSQKWQYGVKGGLELRFTGYDATLQGGWFNKNNIYALKPEEIERLTALLHLGFYTRFHNFGLNISQHFLSPEFKEGKKHLWGQISLEYEW